MKKIWLVLIILSIALPVVAEDGYYILREPVQLYKDTKIKVKFNEYFVFCDKNGENCSTDTGWAFSDDKPNTYKKCLTKEISANGYGGYEIPPRDTSKCSEITQNEYEKYKQADHERLYEKRNIPDDISKKFDEALKKQQAEEELSTDELDELKNCNMIFMGNTSPRERLNSCRAQH